MSFDLSKAVPVGANGTPREVLEVERAIGELNEAIYSFGLLAESLEGRLACVLRPALVGATECGSPPPYETGLAQAIRREAERIDFNAAQFRSILERLEL